jgi:hypothetical protein
MATYEDEIEEVGEGVDHRDQEQGQQARDADLHPSTKIHPYRHGVEFAGGETKSDPAEAHHIVRSVGGGGVDRSASSARRSLVVV